MTLANMTRLLVAVAATAQLVGCASGLSKEECQTVNWQTIGYEDGVQGLPEARIGNHRKACAEYGVTFDLQAYRRGWNEGVERYCQPDNGYRQGRAGRAYTGVCSGEAQTAFLLAYSDGRSRYELENEVSRLSNALQNKRERIDAIDSELRDTGLELISTNMPPTRRVVLLDEMRKLGEERTAVRAEIPRLEQQLERQQQQLQTVSSSSAY